MQISSPAQRGDERFDVVNERDEVVAQATRREVHERKLWHRAVHVLVFDDAGRVFLQKRSEHKDTSPGCWDSSCSGHVDAGEDYLAAAVRELGEEIGFFVDAPAQLKPLFKLSPNVQTGWEFVWVYRLRGAGPFVPNPAEIERAEWFVVDDLAVMIEERPQEFTSAFRLLWPRVAAVRPEF